MTAHLFQIPGALFALAFAPSAMAQDLQDILGKKKDDAKALTSYQSTVRVGRDRVDLSLSPALRLSPVGERKTIGFSAQADLRMICGQYDLKATYQSLLGKEAREEFLEDLPDLLVQELLGSAMDLICQAEPTLCTLIGNYSISANLKASYYKDLCQAVEQAVADAQRKSQADTVDACLKEKQSQGYSLDRAMELCGKKPQEIRGFRGEVVGELDLGRALRDLLREVSLSEGAGKLVDRLSEETRVRPNGGSSKADPEAILGRFRELEAEYAGKLRTLLDKGARRGAISLEELSAAAPQGAPILTEDEVRSLARLPSEERADVVAALSSALANLELGREIHEVERALEAVKGAPTLDEAKRALLEDRLARLRREKKRVEELFNDQALVMGALARAKGLGRRESIDQLARTKSGAGIGERKERHGATLAPQGSLPAAQPRSAGARQAKSGFASDCGGCGFDYKVGSVETPR